MTRVERATSGLTRKTKAELIAEVGRLRRRLGRAQRAEKEFKERARILRTLVDAVPATLNVKDHKYRYVFMNAHQAEKYGTTPRAALGKTADQVLGSDHGKRTQAIDEKVFATGKPVPSYEERWVDAHGRRRVSLTSKVPFRDPQGKVTNVLTVAMDIGEMKKVEQALRESEARFHAFVEHSPSQINIKDIQGRYVVFGPRRAEWWGVARENVIGKTVHDFLPKDVADRFAAQDAEVVRTGRVLETEDSYTADGTRRIVHSTKFPIRDPEGKITAIGLISTDITERRRTEEALQRNEARLQALIDHSPVQFNLKDAQGRYVLFSPVSAKRWGIRSEQAIGKTPHELFPKQIAERYVVDDEKVRRTGRAVAEEEVVPSEDGPRTLLITRFPLFDDQGAVTSVGSIAVDVTDRKNAEIALYKAKVEAELGSRAKSDFIAHMSHELRTPLNSIIGFAHMLKHQTFGPLGHPKYSEYADDVSESGAHLLELINDVLDVSKIEAGELDMVEEEIDIGKAVGACLRMVRDRARSSRLALKTEIDARLPRIRGDERRIRQIMLNLLSNAIKFTPATGLVRIRGFAGPEGGVVLQVTDTGVGIAAEDIPKLLIPFSQIRDPFVRSREGTGLGLYLVKSLVELHGGRLEIESERGKGTTVTVRLPKERTLSPARSAS